MRAVEISGQPISLAAIALRSRTWPASALSSTHRHHASAFANRARSSKKLSRSGEVVYGVSTGFGKLADVQNSARCAAPTATESCPQPRLRHRTTALDSGSARDDVAAGQRARARLQRHAVGSRRASCARCSIAAFIRSFRKRDRSVRAAIWRRWRIWRLRLSVKAKRFSKANVCRVSRCAPRAGLNPVALEAKEGLALLNGTQAMHAVGGLALFRAQTSLARRRYRRRDDAGSVEGNADGVRSADSQARPHPGQRRWRNICVICCATAKSANRISPNDPRVQDAYSLRCMPQVHGAVRGALAHVRKDSGDRIAGRRPTIRSSLPKPAMLFPAGIFTARRWPWRSITRRSR